MSTKRTAAESSNDDQKNEGSDPLSQQQGDAKRAKLVALTDTKLEDLPMELLECIIVKVVAMEVKDMKFAKSVWNEKSELVINRLRTVCSRWSNICATIFFRNEVQRALDGTASDAIRLEMLHSYRTQPPVYRITSMKDEIFMLCRPSGQDYRMNVFDRGNFEKVKDVIPLPRVCAGNTVGCSVSNCVYVYHVEFRGSKADKIIRILKVDEHQFTLSPLITDLNYLSLLSVSTTGNLITISRELTPNPTVVSIYAPNGFLQHEIVLSPAIYGFKYVVNVIQKSNGNLVLAWRGVDRKVQLIEMDMFGSVLRRFQSEVLGESHMNFADIHDRIFMTSWTGRFVLVDSELNRLDFTGVQPYERQYCSPAYVHFNRERNEIMHLYCLGYPGTHVLAIYRFI